MPGRSTLDAFIGDAKRDPAGTLIALDVDGTVAAIAPTPDDATVEEEVRAALDRLAQHYRVWFLSGRDADRAKRLVGVAGASYAGAHGLEALDGNTLRPLAPLEDLSAELDALARAVVEDVPEPALHVGRKRWSVSFHYRAMPRLKPKLKAAIEAHKTPLLKVRAGKMVYEVGPAVEHDKGTALAWIIDTHAPRRVLAAGDDLTDVAMFRAVAQRHKRGEIEGVTVAVLQPGETPPEVLDAADTAVDGVAGLLRLLRILAA